MNRKLPLIITFLVGIIVIVSEFIPHYPFGLISSELENWFLIISGFAIILGQLSLFKVNILKIKYKKPNWPYSVITLASFIIMVGVGILWGTQDNSGLAGNGQHIVAVMGSKPFDYLFHNVYQHLQATMFSLLAFFIASAAYRAFIARTFESNLLLISAILVMLGNTSLGSFLTSWMPQTLNFLHLPKLAEFIMKYPTTAGQRAIMIGAGLGIIGSSLRIILGIERSYLGGK
ncbi:MAG: hypothetical protein SVM86_00230 [Candidatus Cloacimonadota bacterium]|nr:hypothetical protein [Candidatus Cloacimonadota bacterium]